MTEAELNKIFKNSENQIVEFKEAKSSFSILGSEDQKPRKSIYGYVVGIGNKGGGYLILGVTNEGVPVGTNAVQNFPDAEEKLFNILNQVIRPTFEEIFVDGKRIVIVHIPGHPMGVSLRYYGKVLTREGKEKLVEAGDIATREILFGNNINDLSLDQTFPFEYSDLDLEALDFYRSKYLDTHPESEVENVDVNQFLKDFGYSKEGYNLNLAGVLLFGSKKFQSSIIPDAEVVYEYRQNQNQTGFNLRKEFRGPLIKVIDEVWQEVTKHNYQIEIDRGLFRETVPAISEKVFREAIVNALVHRRYDFQSAIFVRQSPENFIIESPGGFPPSVNPNNIIDATEWRNRFLAEALSKINVVERSGQGADLIYKTLLLEGKNIPDYSLSNEHKVILSISCEVLFEEFILFLRSFMKEKKLDPDQHLGAREVLYLHYIYKGDQAVIQERVSKASLKEFVEIGLVEKVGATKGTRYILSKDFFNKTGKKGEYVKQKGLSGEEKESLILKGLSEHKSLSMEEISGIFPSMKKQRISNILQKLKKKGLIYFEGSRKKGVWKKYKK